MTSEDEFLRRLKSIVNSLELWGNLADAKAVEEVAARIQELEAELEGLRAGTHVIVPVEHLTALVGRLERMWSETKPPSALAAQCLETSLAVRAMIRAAQEKADE